MVRHDDVRLLAYLQTGRANVNAFGVELFNFLPENARIKNYAVTDEALLAFMQDAGRDEMQDILLVTHYDGMAGIITTLKANDDVYLAGKQVDNLALALVAPLSTHYDYV
jgi:hypothetical protein